MCQELYMIQITVLFQSMKKKPKFRYILKRMNHATVTGIAFLLRRQCTPRNIFHLEENVLKKSLPAS